MEAQTSGWHCRVLLRLRRKRWQARRLSRRNRQALRGFHRGFMVWTVSQPARQIAKGVSIFRLLLAILVVASVAIGTAVAASSGQLTRGAQIDPAKFVGNVDNPWYPLSPGTRYVYRGV